MPNPNCNWDWTSTGGGFHWPGSELFYCSQCNVVRKYTVLPVMDNIPKWMNDPDLSPDDIDIQRMVMGSFLDEYNVFESNTCLKHPMEIGKENIVYSLDQTVYWEQTIIRLFFYLLTRFLDPDTGLIHNGFNITMIEAGSYTMTEGWEKKTSILQWVFQAGGIDGRKSGKGFNIWIRHNVYFI
eukprot:scaffold108996_cov66-Attheya_sp.AAC.2